jgi:hypothetical protein
VSIMICATDFRGFWCFESNSKSERHLWTVSQRENFHFI